MKLVLALAILLASLPARADRPPPPAVFVLLLGVNEPPSRDLPTLRYADDDAANYFDLFRTLGGKTYLLSEFDENTRRLHPQAAAEARAPGQEQLDAAVDALIVDVALAKRRGLSTVFYFVYAGHGDVEADGSPFLALGDERLNSEAIFSRIVGRVAADRSHVIVDACHSSLLVLGRGPGGGTRKVRGFVPRGEKAAGNIGFLLSTTSGREAHEWEGFQAGVFSHEVRSGLWGAADSDQDGVVSYREIAAFVTRANADIKNERYRPDVFAQAPEGGGELLDLRAAGGGRVELDGQDAGHWQIEDGEGVRLAEWNHGPSQSLTLVRPAGRGRLYLIRTDDGSERVIDPGPRPIVVASLPASPPAASARGVSHHVFDRIFARPFDGEAVATYVPRPLPAWRPPREHALGIRKTSALVVLGLGVAAAGGAAAYSITAYGTDDERRHRERATWLAVGASGAVVTGALLWLWPEAPPGRGLELRPGSFFASWSWSY